MSIWVEKYHKRFINPYMLSLLHSILNYLLFAVTIFAQITYRLSSSSGIITTNSRRVTEPIKMNPKESDTSDTREPPYQEHFK